MRAIAAMKEPGTDPRPRLERDAPGTQHLTPVRLGESRPAPATTR